MSTLTFAIYLLAEHPHVLAKLREEILGKFSTNRLPTYEDLRDLKYLRAVLNETLRLFPAVPGNVRYAAIPIASSCVNAVTIDRTLTVCFFRRLTLRRENIITSRRGLCAFLIASAFRYTHFILRC